MYNFNKIEKKWQERWEKEKTFKSEIDNSKEKYYALIEFPYPSGTGLHVGHVRPYTGIDVIARKKRTMGYNVLFPMGFDAFGLPAENYAIKNKVHPSEAVRRNVEVFKSQLMNLGLSFDWDREINTTDEDYYKWTQWQFLKFYEHGLAYKAKKMINFCPSCKVGLANEDAQGGLCDRCGSEVVQKEKEQWMLKMASYADKLLEGLDETDFSRRVKLGQENWIGKSTGAKVYFNIKGLDEKLEVYTTRPDTLFGVTFMVIAPEHPIINKYKEKINNIKEVEEYKEKALKKSEFERVELKKDKTGIKLEGISCINPINNEEIPVYISDYVMMNYGTGAIMAVPAHDERDFEFAKKFNIDIKYIIKPSEDADNIINNKLNAYTGDGIMINSDFLNEIDNKSEAIDKMITYLKDNNLGEKSIQYRLQDWVFSRQRFWGEPIPIVNCEKCGQVPVKYEDLPVKLPKVTSYEQTDDGESPLSNIKEWYETTCPKCGGHAKRETDTMPNWAGSSWYYLRYMDPHNKNEFASMEAMKYYGMVDWYNGGMEHVTRHLLYARFWHRFLYDIGLVPFKEPFMKRTANGLVLAEDGEKFSKSKGNGINPNDVINEYGADTLRLYEMFIGDFECDVLWNTNGLKGCNRFLDRLYRLGEKLNDKNGYSKNLEVIINKTIKKVSEDIDNMKFNTAIASLMTLINEYDKEEYITKQDYLAIVVLVSPFSPHIASELNEVYNLSNGEVMKWPTYDESKLLEETTNLVIQVNSKIRAKIIVPRDLLDEEIKELVFNNEQVKKHLTSDVKKVIIVKNKLVNIIV